MAQKRLKEFMEANKASVKEMESILGFRPGIITPLMNQKEGCNAYAERIYMDMADAVPLQHKLHALRNLDLEDESEPVKQEAVAVKQDKPSANVSSEAKKRGKKASKAMHIQKASKAEKGAIVERLKAFKKSLGLSWDEVAESLNAAGVFEFKGSRISVQISPSTQMSKDLFNHFKAALDVAEANIGELKQPKPERKQVEAAVTESDTQPENLQQNSADSHAADATDQHETPAVSDEPQIPSIIRIAITREAARRYLEDELGCDMEELRALADPIESLLYALRAGVKARVIVPMHEVQVKL
ncbi:hypothetical protein AL013_10420 [Mariprofundus ferrooxydans]|uniref:Uncharacterized protein n=2 Tax=Mariprofundus ferrooxydans TaxID=314344 RepID=Q0EWB7_9PROT|nr:hypothetical protein SPV1_02913 [Mariprofundus ferrooxydans PV-1]KON46998.1 hypothetical protein AL013_10420 [Mariprofundus ferrooxydans]